MANSITGPSSNHAVWDTFSQRHAGVPFLEHDPLYSLSEELIDSIVRFVPDFFTAEQVKFERDLARTASLGFFLRAPLGTAHESIEHESGPTLAERQEATAGQIDDMLAEELRRIGADKEDREAFFTQHAAQRERIVSRKAAYAGWLLLNAEYRAELRDFRKHREDDVRTRGSIPPVADVVNARPDRKCRATIRLPGRVLPVLLPLGAGNAADVGLADANGAGSERRPPGKHRPPFIGRDSFIRAVVLAPG